MEPHDLRVGKPQTSAIVQLLAAQSFTKGERLVLYGMTLSFSHLLYLSFQKKVV
jgi:hypothetical protein